MTRMEPTVLSRTVVLAATVPSTVNAFMSGQSVFLADRGWNVHIVTSPGPAFDALKLSLGDHPAIVLHELAMTRGPAPWDDMRAFWQWLRLLKEIRPDIVMAGTPKAGFLGVLSAKLVGIPNRVYLVRGLRLEGQQPPSSWVGWVIEKFVCASASSVVCVSRSLRSEMARRRIANLRQTRVLGDGSSNGVDTKRFHPVAAEARMKARAHFGVPSDCLLVGFAGRITADKGIVSLVESMRAVIAQVPNVRLLVVGDCDEEGPLVGEMQRCLNEGWVTWSPQRVDMPTFYAALDLFCLPSRREGFPNVTLEAAASGIAVITTNVTGCRDSVLDGVTGRLVAAEDARELSQSLEILLTDEDLRSQMGLAGREWVLERYRSDVVWSNMLAFMEEVSGSIK